MNPPVRRGPFAVRARPTSLDGRARGAAKAEIKSIHPSQMTPARVLRLPKGGFCQIFERPLSERFVRVIDARALMETLRALPPTSLLGLHQIFLMGGTKRQSTSLHLPWLVLPGKIYLYPFPRRRMLEHPARRPKPHELPRYRLAGARFSESRDGLTCRYTERGLRRWYLYDLLLRAVAEHAQLEPDPFVFRYGYSDAAPWRRMQRASVSRSLG